MAYSDYSGYALQIERRELRLPRWDADGLRVAVLSDIHVNHEMARERAQRAVRMAIGEKPDILVVVGDFANTSRSFALDNIRWSFEDLAGVAFPTIGVMGNHDYWSDRPDRIMEAIRQTRVRLLLNEPFDFQGVYFAGVDDALVGRASTGFFGDGRVSRNVVALLHEPDYVEMMPKHVSLQISGHSHGGQMCLPFGIPVHTPRGAWKYKSGFYPDARTPLYVTRGVGTIGPDLRLFCRPEVSVLTLRSA